MAISWSDVTAIAPELASVAGATQTTVLAEVNGEDIADATWRIPAKADRARRYLAAHLATMTLPGRGGNGPISSESAGPVSRSYAVGAGRRSLESTSYGLEYLRLARLSFGGPWVA